VPSSRPRGNPTIRSMAIGLLAAIVVAACGPSAVGAPTPAPSSVPASASADATLAPPTPPTPTPAPPTLPATPSTAPVGGTAGSATQARIERASATIAADPTNGEAYLELGVALLQRVRETADPSLYPRADEAFADARRLAPDDPLVLVGIGTLQLARHQFAAALTTGRAALAAAPDSSTALGVIVDAQVELGHYKDAATTAQRMIDLRPGLASFARVSYLRELYGDLPGALGAMQQAAAEAGPTPENFAYVSVLVGNLRSLNGDRRGAATAYDDALMAFPGYAPAIAAQGRLAVGDGDLATAIARFGAAADIVPLPEYVISLGEAEAASGDAAAAKRDFDLANVETRLFKANGVVVDLELALFEADHGDRADALVLARAAYAERHTVRTADALGWALYRNGDSSAALKRAHEALRLGSRDPLILYHAGMIEAAAGQRAAARRDLRLALRLDPGFSAAAVVLLRAELKKLG
jgi:tetratricopeptide (TPR) repeat protein